MKKFLIGSTILSVLVITLGLVGFAYAQNRTPEAGFPFGRGMMAGFDGHDPDMMDEYRGHMGGMMGSGYGMMDGYEEDGSMHDAMMAWGGEEGPMHDAMTAAFSEALGLSVEELEARHDAGETHWEIAESEGLSPEEIQDLMSSAHANALADAVADGLMTQEQADWMDGHMEGMWAGEYGTAGHCGGMFNPDN